MEPVREERQIVNVEFAMDGQDALVGQVIGREGYHRSLGNVVGTWKGIRQCHEKAGILRKDPKLDVVREMTLVLHGVIVLLVRVGSVGRIRAGIEKDLEVVDGLHVRRADMVGATVGSDDQGHLIVRGEAAGDEMHSSTLWGIFCVGVSCFNFFCGMAPNKKLKMRAPH